MKTKIGIKKKRSFAKIIGMYLDDNIETVGLVSLLFFSIVFICYPLVFKQIPNIWCLWNFIIVLVGLFIILPLVNRVICVINSMKGMQYIPLTEKEVDSAHCDNIEAYVNFINELITYDNSFWGNYRAKVPTKILNEVIEFANAYYSSSTHIVIYSKEYQMFGLRERLKK